METTIDVRARLRTEWQQLETRLRTLEDQTTPDLLVMRGAGALAEAVNKLDALLAELQIRLWPEPTVPQPDFETLEAWLWDGCCEATDSCMVEPDGRCPHGHPSWLLKLGLI